MSMLNRPRHAPPMTTGLPGLTQELQNEIDRMNYYQYLYIVRFAPPGSKYLVGEVSGYFRARMNEKRHSLGQAEAERISKEVGWDVG